LKKPTICRRIGIGSSGGSVRAEIWNGIKLLCAPWTNEIGGLQVFLSIKSIEKCLVFFSFR
jgi:hypothetical protein